MLTPFMKELTALLEKQGYDAATIQTVTVDGPSHHMDIVRYVVGPNGKRMVDPSNGQPLLTRETYPLLVEGKEARR